MNTALFAASAPIKLLLASRLREKRVVIQDWIQAQVERAPPPFYSSVDLRDAGFKITPVDCNLFPAGFNNLCPEDLRTAVSLLPSTVKEAIAPHSPLPKKVLLVPESHTQNLFYIENLHSLLQLFQDSGLDARLGWIGPLPEGTTSPVSLRSATGRLLTAFPVIRQGDRLIAHGFDPDLIVLNNDFSKGYPGILDKLMQPVIPSHRLGWHSRKKSDHFHHYNSLARDFAQLLDVDPWLLEIQTEIVQPVDFNENEGIEATAEAVGRILKRTQEAYDAHHVSRKPFVFVKNNMGTYGMGITVVHSPEEILKMNRRTKNKMSVGKNHLRIDSVIVQEGVPTATLVDRLISEPVIYFFGRELIGGFLRTHGERSDEDNLNSPGMVFRKLCMSDLRHDEQEPVLELVYGAVARLSALAAGREIRELSPA